eukprot:762820-Hanusia_phi.AAC.12
MVPSRIIRDHKRGGHDSEIGEAQGLVRTRWQPGTNHLLSRRRGEQYRVDRDREMKGPGARPYWHLYYQI